MGVITSSELQVNQVLGYSAIEGHYSQDYYIDNGQPVLKGPNPSTDTQQYSFDYGSKSWQPDLSLTQQAVIQQRDRFLEPVTTISAVQYSLLTTQQQQELQTYYQALLAVTSQPGYPTAVVWPTKPTWL